MGITPHHAESPSGEIDSEPSHSRHSFIRSGMWQKLHNLFARDEPSQSRIDCPENEQWPQTWADTPDPNKHASSTRPLAVGLPRQATFKRQNSERRDRLFPVHPEPAERRAVSSTRNASTSLPRPRATSSPPSCDLGRVSAPAVTDSSKADATTTDSPGDDLTATFVPGLSNTSEDVWSQNGHRAPRPPSTTSSNNSHFPTLNTFNDKVDLREELDSRWILNLSMHFRDKSDREKFFVTYAETPNHWRRVTISCDYRNAEPGSLEMDLRELQFQRDKSMQIYESIRDSLPEIQFYETVTNLKLETTDGRLHVHVTEDVNEIIPYPPRHTVAHVLEEDGFHPMEVRESELTFDSHLSGFVYKVRCKGKTYIKKEIPGPDTVDEFLYEINALHALHGSAYVIQLEAIVLDDSQHFVKGLLISFAEKGAIVDLLYDHRGSIPWDDRCRWAEHAVHGLSEIHEEGYVQGDLTLSNIVVDDDGHAKIIDINRRGCPVGWEPPEIAAKIASQQRISMYIGEKSDLYQLGMTLWALAMDDDEPERHVPPLSVEEFPSEVPDWYQDVVRICLSPRPRDRLSAKELISFFPGTESPDGSQQPKRPALKLRTVKDYIDPADAVGRDDIERLSSSQHDLKQTLYSPESSREDYTFTWPKSSNYELDSETSGYDGPRGRAPPSNFGHLGRDERRHWLPGNDMPSAIDEPEPNIVAISPGLEREFDEVDLDGHPYLISRRTFNNEELEVLERAEGQEQDLQSQSSALDSPEHCAIVSLNSHPPLPPRRPSFQHMASPTSDSTPRNSQAILPTLADNQLDTSSDAPSPADSYSSPCLSRDSDRGLATPQATTVNASIETESSHPATEQNATDSSPQSCSDLTRPETTKLPPTLCYADSGYDEPLGLVEDETNDRGAAVHKGAMEQTPANLDPPSATQGGHQNEFAVTSNDIDNDSHPSEGQIS
ncbi:serine/threonine protein kinase [Capronia epimyces CBS 606.96]|uniref:Serine/threonine protein kinase n=1 Tax=Capronia epimyces CBS 606.96 TaxID=1182542 RepID=W9YE99_9EURO|nr:serine/threonine protein kinase [Capronia epimyces CBS 606.96]EXJ80639.1 serine/threonine protein kinase [Capronia epimyces CBS 606.96]